MLSCNSTSASICGLALSWKYNPQGLGASQFSTPSNKVDVNVKKNAADKKLRLFTVVKGIL
jgi:hypothetical protein